MTTAAPADTLPRADLLTLARQHAGKTGATYGPVAPAQQLSAASDWRFEVEFAQPQGSTVIVQPEETVGHFAEWLGLSPQRLRSLNGLSAGQNLQVGKKMTVDLSRTSPAEFHRRRLEFHRGLQEDFFSNFRVDSTKTYTVRRGDNIWFLCNRVLDAPYWLLLRYNKGQDLQALQPGQTYHLSPCSLRSPRARS